MAAALIAIAAGMAIGKDTVDEKALDRTTTTTVAAEAAGDLVEFKATNAGFAMSYPKTWQAYESTDSEVLFIGSEFPPAENRGGSVLARAVPIGANITQADLATGKQLTDSIVKANPGVEITVDARRCRSTSSLASARCSLG